MTDPTITARIVADALRRVPHHKPIELSDLEQLMRKSEATLKSVIVEWEKDHPQTTLIVQHNPTLVANFAVREFLGRYETYSKDELLHIIALAMSIKFVEEIAAATDAVKRIQI